MDWPADAGMDMDGLHFSLRQLRVCSESPDPVICQTIYAGISALFEESKSTLSIAIRDATYLLDFLEQNFMPEEPAATPSCVALTDFILQELRTFSERHLEKFVGVALPERMANRCPKLCSRLWAELDIVPLVLKGERKIEPDHLSDDRPKYTGWETRGVDEQAESMGRKCVRSEQCRLPSTRLNQRLI